ncbi:hypothetical protein SAMN04487752_1907 [Carnobacterium viridans]|uniref:Uncharacterized protein n=1 Tax=Carnobacterium viridans TaxID=174587 RepID=A0A1H1A562_9LACT|nr:hypothetical protein SAMN04487752_1907 [Carnobacterium viridans]
MTKKWSLSFYHSDSIFILKFLFYYRVGSEAVIVTVVF